MPRPPRPDWTERLMIAALIVVTAASAILTGLDAFRRVFGP